MALLLFEITVKILTTLLLDQEPRDHAFFFLFRFQELDQWAKYSTCVLKETSGWSVCLLEPHEWGVLCAIASMRRVSEHSQ